MHDNTRHMKGCEVCVVDTRDTTAGGASRFAPCSLGGRSGWWLMAALTLCSSSIALEALCSLQPVCRLSRSTHK